MATVFDQIRPKCADCKHKQFWVTRQKSICSLMSKNLEDHKTYRPEWCPLVEAWIEAYMLSIEACHHRNAPLYC